MKYNVMVKRLAEIEKQMPTVTDGGAYADLYVERAELVAAIMDCESQMEEQAIDDELHNR
jgi:hypothetical protein